MRQNVRRHPVPPSLKGKYFFLGRKNNSLPGKGNTLADHLRPSKQFCQDFSIPAGVTGYSVTVEILVDQKSKDILE